MEAYSAALVLTASANAFAVFRVVATGARRQFPILFLFLCFQFVQSIATLCFSNPYSWQYQNLYIVAEPLNWFFFVLMVREMYRLAFADFPGLSSLAKWATYVAGGLAAVLAVVMFAVAPKTELSNGFIFEYIVYWERGVFLTLTLFIVLMVLLLSRYPIRLEANVAVDIAIFSAYFFGQFVLLSIAIPGTRVLLEVRNYGLLVLYACCFVLWGATLKNRLEVSILRVGRSRDPFEEERLLQQLAMINNVLVRSVRQ